MKPINADVFKAYDIRGLATVDIHEDLADQVGRAFVVYLGAHRIAVGRDMRLSSPSIAAAFFEGARIQGASVVDYGLVGTDMLYYAVARDEHDGGAEITAPESFRDTISRNFPEDMLSSCPNWTSCSPTRGASLIRRW